MPVALGLRESLSCVAYLAFSNGPPLTQSTQVILISMGLNTLSKGHFRHAWKKWIQEGKLSERDYERLASSDGEHLELPLLMLR